MTTLFHKCELLGDLYLNQSNLKLQKSEGLQSFLEEHGLILAVCLAITNELVEPTPTAENLIDKAIGDLAEIFGMDTDSLTDLGSLSSVIQFEDGR